MAERQPLRSTESQIEEESELREFKQSENYAVPTLPNNRPTNEGIGDTEGVCEDKEALDDSQDTGHGSVSPACHCVLKAQQYCHEKYSNNRGIVAKVLAIVGLLCYVAYFIAACFLDYKRALPLIVITSIVIGVIFVTILKEHLGQTVIDKTWNPLKHKLRGKRVIIKWMFIVATALLVIVITAVIIGRRVDQYRGLAGFIFFTLLLFFTSHNPAKVSWRPVLWGMLLNFLFAVIILKTKAGVDVFRSVADAVAGFLQFTDEGSKFVFGKKTFEDHFFAFKVLPTIVFFSCVISLLYYLGVMQAVIKRIAYVMQLTMGTSPTESLSCAGNIFVGQTEAPIMIRPFLDQMTRSELHAVMTGGFATIAGGVLAAYIEFDIDPAHLICASVMNAPMALSVSKLSYPETEKPKYMVGGKRIKFEKPAEENFIAAAAAGASQSIGLVANIAANLIAFLSLLAFVNWLLSWLGSLVDHPELSFELICSYLLWPVALLIGVDMQDCGAVAELIGTKFVLNEFLAYQKLQQYIKNKDTCQPPFISKRSEIIATYALCGFANLSSIGVQLGGIGAMAPARRSDLARLVVRALFAGTITTLMTGALAGMLTEADEIICYGVTNSTLGINSTLSALSFNSTLPVNGTSP